MTLNQLPTPMLPVQPLTTTKMPGRAQEQAPTQVQASTQAQAEVQAPTQVLAQAQV